MNSDLKNFIIQKYKESIKDIIPINKDKIIFQMKKDNNIYKIMTFKELKKDLKIELEHFFKHRGLNFGLINTIIKLFGKDFKKYMKGDVDIEDILNDKTIYSTVAEFEKKYNIQLDYDKLIKDTINKITKNKDRFLLDVIYRPNKLFFDEENNLILAYKEGSNFI